MDDADRAQIKIEQALADAIARNSADIPAGKSGDCDDCGRWSGRLIEGLCAPCRDHNLRIMAFKQGRRL